MKAPLDPGSGTEHGPTACPDQPATGGGRPRRPLIGRDKLVPIVVALPLFLQNVDSSVMATALPAMAQSLQVDALRLNLAITAYLISLAVFLPASGWLADRFGPRRVFCAAVAVFAAASALCGMANSLEMLVACRILQGMGGAMMVPVGRLIMLRSVLPGAMVAAMVWFTVPPAFGRMIGPLVGGMMVTWISWRWIFLVNVPLGALAIALALGVLDADEPPPQEAPSFDAVGFILLGTGLASFLAALESASSHLVPAPVATGFAAVGLTCLTGYWLHSRRSPSPLIDLGIFKSPTFFAATVGGLPLRLAVGALPFLLPLLLQLGFGLSPLDSGLLTMGSAVGSLATRALLTRALRSFGFRRLLIGSTVCVSLSYVTYANFGATTPHLAIFAATVAGGLVMSMVMVSLQTLAYTEIPKSLMGHSTAMSAIVQQMSFSLGVVIAVEMLRVSVWLRGGQASALAASDFPLAFYAFAFAVPFAILFLVRLRPNVGAELRQAG